MSQMTYIEFRKAFPRFAYEGYAIEGDETRIHVEYSFSLRGESETIAFRPSFVIANRAGAFQRQAVDVDLENLIFHIGLVECVSYWKAVCSPELIIWPRSLSPRQMEWFQDLFYQGLGEFRYLNKIKTSKRDFIRFRNHSPNTAPLPVSRFPDLSGQLIPIGGGKDSIVTLELIRGAFERDSSLAFLVNPIPASFDVLETAGMTSQAVVVNRMIDPKLIELNKRGFLNGHTPYSALLAFLSLFACALTGKRYAAFSNESSANEPTAYLDGEPVNHQYSKSFAFETSFRDYAREFLTPDIEYFSFLRPFTESAIAALFARYPRYFPVFNSCNKGGRENHWCGACAKCLFVYIVLAPFMERNQTLEFAPESRNSQRLIA